MRTFAYTQRVGGKLSFGHSSSKFHDDFVYALNLALYSLRSEVLQLYVLGSFQCVNRSPKARLCFLMNPQSSLELQCARNCLAYERVYSMRSEYIKFNLDDDFTVPEFFHAHVKHTGARISQVV
jgi:hypothetical protein